MKNKCVFLLAILVFLVPGVLFAPEADKSFQVYVSVTSKDQKAFIESHIKRELRSLHDVEIASWDTAEYFLDIVALESEYKSGRKTGDISVAYCWYRRIPLPKDYRGNLIDPEFHQSFWDAWDKYNSFRKPHLGVMNFSTKELDAACKTIVAKFDQAMLERWR